ncbi:MAG TPA: cytochrome ubiquinol oxidase subunit I [Vicinamibacteria bacterium]|nr:cytochrome ubiquinol oxidase subunit I [Vicinamibacteria bacterium]
MMPPELLAARSQMAFTLGFHIILACLGVAMPAIVLVANGLGLRRGEGQEPGDECCGERQRVEARNAHGLRR